MLSGQLLQLSECLLLSSGYCNEDFNMKTMSMIRIMMLIFVNDNNDDDDLMTMMMIV